jgi:hypothetical protein
VATVLRALNEWGVRAGIESGSGNDYAVNTVFKLALRVDGHVPGSEIAIVR